MTLDQYHYQAPLLIFANRVETVDASLWRSGERWIDALAQKELVKGVVLPLELAGSAAKRQQLWGMELLNWLRWSGPEHIKYLPVFALTWETLADILRRKPDLLVTTRGTRFARLPAHDVVLSFIQNVRDGTAEKCNAEALAASCRGSLGHAAELTYHDLANDNYAAYRFWKGYLHALKTLDKPSTKLRAELNQAEEEDSKRELECLKVVESKRRQPWFKQLQASLVGRESPAYPEVEASQTTIRRHIEKGLPEKTRILFVDDEFEKGMAEVLLRVLFGQGTFTFKGSNEWVYSQQIESGGTKARLVCVKDVKTAGNWLLKWGDLPFDDLDEGTVNEFRGWIHEWARALGWTTFPPRGADRAPDALAEVAFAAARGEARVLDDYKAPAKMKTILLLDLRLTRESSGRIYPTRELPSIALRARIKEYKPELPVIVFTASRQALNYAEVMSSAGRIDGWLCKEAPDVPEDDRNSANAVAYLLSRLHLFAGTASWYREQMKWEAEDQLDYRDLYEGLERQASLEHVTKCADELHALVACGKFAEEIVAANKGFLGFVQTKVSFPQHTRLIQLLVARRIAVATLLETATVSNGKFRWNEQRFGELLRGSYAAREATYLRGIINFRREAMLASYREELLKLLLPEEYDWLLQLDLAPEKKEILRKIRSEVLTPGRHSPDALGAGTRDRIGRGRDDNALQAKVAQVPKKTQKRKR